jgi:hypothetical protein
MNSCETPQEDKAAVFLTCSLSPVTALHSLYYIFVPCRLLMLWSRPSYLLCCHPTQQHSRS